MRLDTIRRLNLSHSSSSDCAALDSSRAHTISDLRAFQRKITERKKQQQTRQHIQNCNEYVAVNNRNCVLISYLRERQKRARLYEWSRQFVCVCVFFYFVLYLPEHELFRSSCNFLPRPSRIYGGLNVIFRDNICAKMETNST